ncbi:MAG: hypothetical protein HYV63_32015 [Candidatus Schekmanbacteria bacterium]|nr:hypothetical protein [Candidatus Schekmanbacteria bacterium]
MRRRIEVFLVVSAALFGALSPQLARAAGKFRIAVVEFENRAGNQWGRLGSGASDMLATELVKTGQFSVIEREKLQAVLNEQALGMSGAITPQSAAQVGRLLGVQAIVTGAVTEFGESQSGVSGGGYFGVSKREYRAAVDVRIVDTGSGEIVFADNAASTDSIANVSVMGFGGGGEWDEQKAGQVMRGAISTLTTKIGQRFKSWSPAPMAMKVANVKGDQVWLNAGKGAVNVGDSFSVFRKGEEIKDPDTGQVLDVEMTKVGELIVTEVKDKYSIANVKSGSGFQSGDIVK